MLEHWGMEDPSVKAVFMVLVPRQEYHSTLTKSISIKRNARKRSQDWRWPQKLFFKKCNASRVTEEGHGLPPGTHRAALKERMLFSLRLLAFLISFLLSPSLILCLSTQQTITTWNISPNKGCMSERHHLIFICWHGFLLFTNVK